MHVDYGAAIEEPERTLADLEERLRGTSACDRVRLLRLLRAGRCKSQSEAALLLGYSPRQVRRWWKVYQEGGLQALLACESPGGSRSRLTEDALVALREQIQRGHLVLLKEVQHYLQDEHGITYRSLQGILDMLRSHGLALQETRAAPRTRRRNPRMRTFQPEKAWGRPAPLPTLAPGLEKNVAPESRGQEKNG